MARVSPEVPAEVAAAEVAVALEIADDVAVLGAAVLAAVAPIPRAGPKVRRRVGRVPRSNSSPRSWSGWGVLAILTTSPMPH